MIETLTTIQNQLRGLTAKITADPSLPPEKEYIAWVEGGNAVRKEVIALDIALRRRHQERHPETRVRMEELPGPTEPLDPETKAEIDSTP